MKEEISPRCQKCQREQHINLQKPFGENVFVCKVEDGAIRIQDSLECVELDCAFCSCPEILV
jgi:hypothetical protein